MIFGVVVRVVPAWSSDFPLNDGGLFLAMAQEVQRHHYRLPDYVAYNGTRIPFAYPPLGFYLAALLGDLTNTPLVTIVRLLPAFLALLTIPAIAPLCGSLLRLRTPMIVAIFAFTLLPRSTIWLIMGGGLTRAPGALFAMLTLWQVHRLFARSERRALLLASIFGGMTVLSHAEWAWFTAYSAAIFFLFVGRTKRAFGNAILVALGVGALSAPWWATILVRHGPGPLLAAAQSGSWSWAGVVSLLSFQISTEPFLPLLGVLGLIGGFVCLARRDFLLPIWLIAILVIQPRSSATLATIPLALLIGIALDEAIFPALRRYSPRAATEAGAGERAGLAGRAAPLFAAYCLLYATVGAATLPITQPALHALPREERGAMAWIATNTGQDSTFLVLPALAASQGWWEDHTSEWFPVLTSRRSVATVQGSEWLPDQAFARSWRRAHALRSCTEADTSCLATWAIDNALPYTHVYVATGGLSQRNSQIIRALRADSEYRLVFENDGAVVFARASLP